MNTGVYKDNVLVATGLVLIKRLPLSFCMYYLPRGPIMDYRDNVLVQYYFDQLKKVAKKEYCIFIKLILTKKTLGFFEISSADMFITSVIFILPMLISK